MKHANWNNNNEKKVKIMNSRNARKNNEIDKNLYIILFPNFSVIKDCIRKFFRETIFVTADEKSS